MAVKTFGVIGAGQMGNGIAQVAANPGGLNVIMNDISDQFVDRGFDSISKNLDRLVAKEKITADQKKEILGRIKKSTNLEDMKNADFVVEAAVEREDLKLNIFKKLDEVCNPGYQYIVDPHYEDCRCYEAARQGHRDALHEPGSRDEARGDHQGIGDIAGYL
jgi:3-hydroxyacyl-CoA dehydrogenase